MPTPEPLSAGQRTLRLTAIALIAGALALAFAASAGWLTPARLTPGRIVDALQGHDGLHPGFRRAHAKGVCVIGEFAGNGAGAALSKAALFAAGARVPVVGRFSTGGGIPDAPDGRVVFHSMALSFTLPDGSQWRTGMNHVPIFPVATPQDFLAFQLATRPAPATGKPDPARVAAYLAAHPETRAFMAWLREHPLPSSFANGTYYSVNAFRFIDAAGTARTVRWRMQPEAPFAELDKATLAQRDADFLFADLATRLRAGPLRWQLIVTLAGPGDAGNDATRPWPADRRELTLGTLTLERATLEDDGPCRDLTFDPLILPAGIAASDDPLLAARSAAYARSFTRRAGEPAPRSALARDPSFRETVR
ncbi:catalase family peroxidase [Solimonas flava]|uniref:catalase family peroxidase n=1 Tax=Solimonas flava TaxID=415849 RepID=UPI000409F675|nr:catalase family peroxidase [Solimonas flava]